MINWSHRENYTTGSPPLHPPFPHTPPAQPPVGKRGAGDVRQRWRRRKQPRLRLARWRRGRGAAGWSEGVKGEGEEKGGRGQKSTHVGKLTFATLSVDSEEKQ